MWTLLTTNQNYLRKMERRLISLEYAQTPSEKQAKEL